MNINKPLVYIDFSIKCINGESILIGTLRSNYFNEFTSKDANIPSSINRAIHVDDAQGGGHAPRMKVYGKESYKPSDPCISLSIDKGKVTIKGNPKSINMSNKELKLYRDICTRNWDLMCYGFNNNKKIDEYMLNDEKRRNDKDNPKTITRDRNDGGYRYTEIRNDGAYGAKIKHNMVEFPGKEPIEEK